MHPYKGCMEYNAECIIPYSPCRGALTAQVT